MIRRSFLGMMTALPAAILHGCGNRGPFYFIQMADTQLGMIAGGDGSDFSKETEIVEEAVAHINAMHPKPGFVVVCGDLTDKNGHSSQIAEYKRLTGLLRDDISVYNVAGNHDLTPSIGSIDQYRREYGNDWYSFAHNGWLFLVINSVIIKTPDEVTGLDHEQKSWLETELASLKTNGYFGAAVFMHHPFFDNDIDEEDGYHSITRARRREFLDMFAEAGVDAVFSGHRHTTIPEHVYDGVKLINTNALCNSFDNSPGLRIVRCSEHGLEQVFRRRDEIPDEIDTLFDISVKI